LRGETTKQSEANPAIRFKVVGFKPFL